MYSKVLAIALDAADSLVIENLLSEGYMSNLASLIKRGTYASLSTSAEYLTGSPWPSFYTGRPVSDHGLYHDFQWQPQSMQFKRPNPNWLNLQPFWRFLNPELKVIAYDLPMVPQSTAINGYEITGWASHDKLQPASSFPKSLLKEVSSKFGRWSIAYEAWGPESLSKLLKLRDDLIVNTRKSTELALWLLNRPWDLALIAFSALHRGGHRLWDLSSCAEEISASDSLEFNQALCDLYLECDLAVGQLIKYAGDATILVFSLHGMTHNTSRVDLLDSMLSRILSDSTTENTSKGVFKNFVELIPLNLRRELSARVPNIAQNTLMTKLANSGKDWANTKAWSLRADLQGYIRINLKGREGQGIVNEGREFDSLCELISEGLFSFKDALTKQSLVKNIHRSKDLWAQGKNTILLPDLIVNWSESPAKDNHHIISSRYGNIQRKFSGRVPNGRSGNHRSEGFLIASGPNIQANIRLKYQPDILDLPVSIIAQLGGSCKLELSGQYIPELLPSRLRNQTA